MMTICGYLVVNERYQVLFGMNIETIVFYLNSLTGKNKFPQKVNDPMEYVRDLCSSSASSCFLNSSWANIIELYSSVICTFPLFVPGEMLAEMLAGMKLSVP